MYLSAHNESISNTSALDITVKSEKMRATTARRRSNLIESAGLSDCLWAVINYGNVTMDELISELREDSRRISMARTMGWINKRAYRRFVSLRIKNAISKEDK